MAIKEFIIGPQNYFEEGYFNGDYTYPNVSKSFLECDVDNFKGGRVVTGEYFQDNYIDGTYWHNNSIKTELVCDAMIVQEATVSMQGYYVEGYFGEGYYQQRGSIFVLSAELEQVGEDVFGSGTLSSSASMSISVGKITSAISEMSATFTQTAYGARDRDIDLFAFSDAALTAQIGVIKQNNIEVSSVFSIATDGRRFRDLASAETSLFDLSIENSRSRATSLDAQAAFSLTSIVGVTKPASSNLSSSVSLSANGGYPLSSSANLISYSTIFASRYVGTDRPTTVSGSFDASRLINSSSRLTNLTDIPNADNWYYQTYVSVSASPSPFVVDAQELLYIPLGTKSISISLRWRSAQGATLSIDALGVSASLQPTGLVEISFTGGQKLSIYVNGTRVATGTVNTAGWSISGSDTVRFANGFPRTSGSNTWTAYTDRAWLTYGDYTNGGSTSYTTPTPANDESTIFLYQFNGNGQEDTAITFSAASALTSSSTVNAVSSGTFNRSASASLSSAATLSALVGKITNGNSALASTASLVSNVYRTKQFNSSQSSSATLTSTIGSIKQFASTENSAFSPSIVCNANKAGVALLENVFELSSQPVKTATTTTTVNSSFSLTSATTLSAGLAADVSSAFTINVQAYRNQPASASLESTVSLACDFIALNPAAASLSSTSSLTADITHFVGLSSNMSSAFTQTSDLKRIRFSQGAFSSEFSQSLIALRIRPGSSDFESLASSSITAVKTPGININLSSEFTQTTNAVITADARPSLTAIATELTAAIKNATGTVSLSAESSLSALAGTLKEYENNYLSGARSYSGSKYPRVLIENAPVLGFGPRTPGFLASVWFKIDSNQTYQTIWAQGGDTQYNVSLCFINDTLLLRYNYDPDEPTPQWSNVKPNDSLWHHVLLWAPPYICNVPGQPGYAAGNWYRLWFDGQELVFGGSYQAAYEPGFANGNYVQLGYSQVRQLTAGYDYQSSVLVGGFAQLWMGKIDDVYDTIDIIDFYDDGFVDLGTSGRGKFNQLPSPYVYNTLSDPWTNSFAGTYSTAEKPATTSIGLPSAQAYSYLTLTPQAVLVNAGTLVSESSLVAGISYQISQDADLTSSSSMITDADQRIGVISNQTASVTVTANPYRTKQFAASLTSAFSGAFTIGTTERFEAALNSAFSLDASGDVKLPIRAEADLITTASLNCSARSFSDNTILVASAGTMTVEATLIPPTRIEANLTATFTVSAIIGSIEQFAVLTASSGTMTINAGKIARVISSSAGEFTAYIDSFKFTGAVADLTAFNAVLTAGEVINIDPYLQLKIEPEGRGLIILQENRLITIEQETRVNTI